MVAPCWRSPRRCRGIFMLVAVFWINLFIFGLFRSGGVIYVALLDTFGSSHELAAWPISLAGAAICMIGPVASALTRVLSIRVIVTIGVITTFISASLCYLAQNVITILVLIGIFYGSGVGLTCTLTPIFITGHFEQHRSIACGLAYLGSTVGSFFWPTTLEYLIEEYGLRGSFLIYGALMLHGVLGSIILRPAVQQQAPSGACSEKNHDTERAKDEEVTVKPRVRSSISECENACGASVSGVYMVCSKTDLRPIHDGSSMNGPRRDSRSEKRYSLLSAPSGSTSEFIIHEEPKTPLCSSAFRVILNDLRILENRYFILITLSAVSYFFVFATFIIVVPDYAADNGISRQDAVFLLSIFGVADMLSKPVPGLLTYKKIATNKTIYVTGGFLTGLLMFLMALLHTHTAFVAITFLYGLVAGGLIFLSPVLLTEFLGMENATVAFGTSNFLIGIASLFRPLIIGYFKDHWHSYDGLFYTMAVASLFQASVWFICPMMDKVKQMAHGDKVTGQSASEAHV